MLMLKSIWYVFRWVTPADSNEPFPNGSNTTLRVSLVWLFAPLCSVMQLFFLDFFKTATHWLQVLPHVLWLREFGHDVERFLARTELASSIPLYSLVRQSSLSVIFIRFSLISIVLCRMHCGISNCAHRSYSQDFLYSECLVLWV